MFAGCNGQSLTSYNDAKYQKYKAEFDTLFTNHFPRVVSSETNQIINSKDFEGNNVAFMLYEYDLRGEKLDSIIARFSKYALAKYSSRDTCLLVVNRFVSIESYENRQDVHMNDTMKLNKDCYENAYPIPNFINYKYRIEKEGIKLNNNFDIYVLEAKSGKYTKEFDLKPSPQMPDKWKNGYSKGIAVSLKDHTVIYWSLMW